MQKTIHVLVSEQGHEMYCLGHSSAIPLHHELLLKRQLTITVKQKRWLTHSCTRARSHGVGHLQAWVESHRRDEQEHMYPCSRITCHGGVA